MSHPLNALFNNRFDYPVEVNLGASALFHFRANGPYNPLLDPAFCQAWVEYLTRNSVKVEGAKYSFGGYLEDRTFMWRGSYLNPEMVPDTAREKPGNVIHLGVDVNVRQMTEVWCPLPGKVVQAFHDDDQQGGWGGVCLVKLGPKSYVIFAHLDLDDTVVAGATWKKSKLLGRVAAPDRNGGWYPHLHLQGLTKAVNIKKLDGYSMLSPSLRTGLRSLTGIGMTAALAQAYEKTYPNPLKLLGIIEEKPL